MKELAQSEPAAMLTFTIVRRNSMSATKAVWLPSQSYGFVVFAVAAVVAAVAFASTNELFVMSR